ncbi:MAG: hypothetical protein K2X86_09945, partial [Cytophagaceae bacterium]|nr:hypothetical protein [Cytophagaceae bacterium]
YKGIQNLSFTANGGVSSYVGDLCNLPGCMSYAFGLGVNYKLWPRVQFGTEFHYISLQGKDQQLTSRNLQFSSTNREFLAFGIFFMIDDVIRISRDRGNESRFFKAYIVSGVGLLRYSPTSSYFAVPTDSAFVVPEGVGYPRMGLVLPAGLGLTWKISNRISLITEAAYRFTFTDYLDDVSVRANTKKNDGYGILDFKLQIHPFVPAKKKTKTLAPPQKYEGPKGTDTWKNRKKEEPVQKNNNYYEEEPTEEKKPEEEPNPDEETPTEEEEPTLEEKPVEEELK